MTASSRRSFGQIKRKDSGRYQASFVPPGDGADRRVNAPHTFATKREAERWLAAAETDLRRGDFREQRQSKVTVEAFGHQFITDHSQRLAPGTATNCWTLWRNRVQPTFGHLLLRDVKPSAIRAWIAALTRTGLSASQVRQSYRLLSQIMDAAVEDEHLTGNPCASLRKALPRLPEPDPRILTPDEVAALRAAMPEGRDRLMLDLMAWTGVRIGELFALRRRSVDVLHRRLIVSESVAEVRGALIVGDTKAHQTRRVSLPGFLLTALEQHLSTAVEPEADAWLFPSRSGAPLRYGSWRQWVWDPAAVEAGLATPKPQPVTSGAARAVLPGRPGPKPKPKLHDLWTVTVTPHAMRATHASVVAAQHGVLEAARRLGHSNASITTAHYARPLEGGDDAVAEWLDSIQPVARGDRDAR